MCISTHKCVSIHKCVLLHKCVPYTSVYFHTQVCFCTQVCIATQVCILHKCVFVYTAIQSLRGFIEISSPKSFKISKISSLIPNFSNKPWRSLGEIGQLFWNVRLPLLSFRITDQISEWHRTGQMNALVPVANSTSLSSLCHCANVNATSVSPEIQISIGMKKPLRKFRFLVLDK